MKLYGVQISENDPRVVFAWFKASPTSPSIKFETRMATADLAGIVLRGVAKANKFRKVRNTKKQREAGFMCNGYYRSGW